MKKSGLMMLLIVSYVAGIYTGVYIPNVNAIVKVPSDNNKPVSSGAKTAPSTKNGNSINIVKPAKPVATKLPEKPAVRSSTVNPSSANSSSSNNPQQSPISSTPVTSTDFKPTATVPQTNKQPVEIPAATSQGVTLYSLSLSMQADIERLENDVAILKNKVHILNAMRQ